jgi:hypothetical protein
MSKENIIMAIHEVKQCADAETVVELSVERYEELLRKAGESNGSECQ